MKRFSPSTWMVALMFVPAAFAQDSVSLDPTCGVGDAVSPWADADAVLGSEQCNDYIVDLAPFQSAWGDSFTIAPLVKTSKTSAAFSGSLFDGQSISKDYLKDQPFVRSTYDLWTAPTFGVNNDPSKNAPGTPIVTSEFTGDQFAVAFSEFSGNYSGVIAATVNRLPEQPNRLYVHRTVAATNSCDDASDLASFGGGAVDANGNVAFRADGNGAIGGCDLQSLPGVGGEFESIFMVDSANRDCAARNVVSDDYPGGEFDAAVTSWLVQSAPENYLAPNLIPESVAGAAPVYIGTRFVGPPDYVRGASFPTTADTSHLAPVTADHRGALGYCVDNCAALSSSAGIAAVLGQDSLGVTNILNVFGVDSAGTVTGTLGLVLPPLVTDNSTGFTNLAGMPEFDHYHGLVGLFGGAGQVALGIDRGADPGPMDDRLLVAAAADHPENCGNDCAVNYIPVARVNCNDSSVEWTMAGYNDGTTSEAGTGKPILDGPGGAVIGRMVTLDNVTGPGGQQGPSVSSPMIDAKGNVYFLSSIELFDDMGGSTFNNGLIRAVYDPANFAYELDLLLTLGGDYQQEPFTSQNTGLLWDISFMIIATDGAVAPSTAFSGNITNAAHLGMAPEDIPTPRDPRALGGMVIAVEAVYDSDEDGFPDECGDPKFPSDDQDYDVLLYIAAGEAVPAADACFYMPVEGTKCASGTWPPGCVDPPTECGPDPLPPCCCDPGSPVAKTTQADLGGSDGACVPDGTCDGQDRFLALNCFENDDTLGTFGFPCEVAPPTAVNTDPGSAECCDRDGICDGNDVFHTLNCFENDWFDGTAGYRCSCIEPNDCVDAPPVDCSAPAACGPSPAAPPRPEVGVTLRAPKRVRAGDLVEVDVFMDDALEAVRGYQLHLGVSGGTRGQLELVDIVVDEAHRDYALAKVPGIWKGFNRSRSQMLVGMDQPLGVPTAAGAYLATYVYRVPKDAAGSFAIELLYDDSLRSVDHRTFLFTSYARVIHISEVAPVTVQIEASRRERLGVR